MHKITNQQTQEILRPIQTHTILHRSNHDTTNTLSRDEHGLHSSIKAHGHRCMRLSGRNVTLVCRISCHIKNSSRF
jgi:hypothetical protein